LKELKVSVSGNLHQDRALGVQGVTPPTATRSERHNFIFFEDRKFVDIGNTAQRQYHGGALRISEWAHIVNASVLAGKGTVKALAQTAGAEDFEYKGDRALIILAEMTTEGSLAVRTYTESSVDIAKRHKGFVIGLWQLALSRP